MPSANTQCVSDGAGACPPYAEAGTFHWYALRLRSNSEFKVESALEGARIEAFLPTWSEKVRWADRDKTIVRPLIPGYVFFRPECRADLLYVLTIGGVVGVLPSSLKPEPVPDDEIDSLRRVMSGKLHARPCEFVAGDKVQVDSGPFAGVKGIVVRTRGSEHVVISFEMLRRSVKVEIDAELLRELPEAA